MGKSQETVGKKEKEKKKAQKRKDKDQKRVERKATATKGKTLEEMFAYVDEYGNITTTPPTSTRKLIFDEADIVIGVARQSDVKEVVDVIRKGTVTFFNDSKGYGFIQDHGSQQSVFVHINAANFPVKENDQVTFEIGQGQKGPAAMNVRLAE
jgi:cold shock CspA family protein